MKKTLGFFNAFKMPRSRYGDFDKMSLNMEPVFFCNASKIIKHVHTHYYQVLGGYQKQEKKRPQAVLSAILSIHNHSSQKNQRNKF
jgi:hypothetical protein